MIKEFFKPKSVTEAIALKKQHGDQAIYFSGGTWINSALSLITTEKVITLEKLSLDRIKTQKNSILIGSAVTLQELIAARKIPKALKTAVQTIPSRNIRNIATLGGHIAANQKDSAIIPTLIGLSAAIVLEDRRELPIEEYILEKNQDLITAITLPPVNGSLQIEKISLSSASCPVMSICVRVFATGEKIREVCIAVGGIADAVVRLPEIESQIRHGELTGIDPVQQAVSGLIQPVSDMLGSAAYKKYRCGIAVAKCVESCLKAEKNNGDKT